MPKNENSFHFSNLVREIVSGELVFRPAPPGDVDANGNPGLKLAQETIPVDVLESEMKLIEQCLSKGFLEPSKVKTLMESLSISKELQNTLISKMSNMTNQSEDADDIEKFHDMDKLAMVAAKIIDRVIKSALRSEPLTEIHFSPTDKAKVSLAIGWHALVERGIFPLPPLGSKRFKILRTKPCGAMHFVSASDLDAGYFYVIGIAQSPEAQSLQTIDVTYGLDGELIVPGQAVSPIPPFLAMATRLFAISIPTSSNISEEVHSIPLRTFPHPTNVLDLEPHRGGITYPVLKPKNLDEAITDLKIQLNRFMQSSQMSDSDKTDFEKETDYKEPEIGAVFDVTGMETNEITYWLNGVFEEKEINDKRKLVGLFLNVERMPNGRVEKIKSLADIASKFGLKYVLIADDVEDSMLPDLLEYLTPDELNDVADYADEKKIVVLDGRPVDPIYTAATAAQRIQSVFTTLSVDILKMGMWLCLDAVSARKVWKDILKNPHIQQNMLLMPIGIVEPWNAFVDNRNSDKTPRAILDPFEKIKFMIEEAKLLGMSSLLTDTRHKEKWVLLGRKTPADKSHPREQYVKEKSGKILGRTKDSAIPLLSWNEFMACESLARKNGILLGQAGSIEGEQVFDIISKTTYDAAKDKLNPATAIWTAETERVLRTGDNGTNNLQKERSSALSPFLAVINRGIESHAKLDGWLQYLSDCNINEEKLKTELNDKRPKLNKILENCMRNQQSWKDSASDGNLSNYQKSWDEYRKEYLVYHYLIKDSFTRIQNLVKTQWSKST